MSKQQKKLEKRRSKEKATKQKLRVLREAKYREEKESRLEAKEVEDHKKMVNERLKLERWIKAAEGKIPEELEDRIYHNIEILKSLEAEHAAEIKARQDLRDKAAREQAVTEIKVDCVRGDLEIDDCLEPIPYGDIE